MICKIIFGKCNEIFFLVAQVDLTGAVAQLVWEAVLVAAVTMSYNWIFLWMQETTVMRRLPAVLLTCRTHRAPLKVRRYCSHAQGYLFLSM